MEKKESLQFIRTVILLARIQSSVGDRFFSEKLIGMIYDFSSDFIKLATKENTGDIGQYRILAEKCLADISSLENILEELVYLGITPNSLLLLRVKRNLLVIKLKILRAKKETPMAEKKIKCEEKISEEKISISKPRKVHRITPNKKKILDFIRSSPNTRTKDIIFEFNAISGRTVKRNLTELAKEGLIRKRVDNKAVYYYASE